MARKHVLNQECKLFKVQQEDIILYVLKRFIHNINNFIGLDKNFEKEKLDVKMIKCLDRS